MKIVRVETLISVGKFSNSQYWRTVRKSVQAAIRAVDWPRGSGKFTIYPESGKKRRSGNGVTPIKLGLMAELERQSWKLEAPLDIATVSRPGKLDAILHTNTDPWPWSGRQATFHPAIEH